ncbi:aminopeptidase N [Granulicoccus sp. GXG6511]|uniref:aminopeptidase N n=1 Tax=Granulicoccus sp. GXG6511 TaxID=3381351 RepID=UPI003D7CD918
MDPANITRADTAARAGLIATRTYEILVDLSGRDPDGKQLSAPAETYVTSSRIRFTASAGVTGVDVIADSILTATLNGKPLDTSGFDGARLPLELTDGEHDLVVTALHRFSRSGQGMHRFMDVDERVYLYTQFEPADSRRVFACFEQPDLKARFSISVIAPRDWLVVSNSADVRPSALDSDFARWDFAPTEPLPTYLTAIVAGDYHRVGTAITSAAGRIPASVICRASLAEHLDTARIMAITQAGFEVFEEHFGAPFPFDSYDQAFVPEYNAGAMENAGLVTFRDDLVFRSRATQAQFENRDNTILHELAHMWFGNLVTMRWWDDLWLKESFAEWASHFAQSQIDEDPRHAWAAFNNARKTWAYRADQLPSTHPIAADMVDLEAVQLNFDGITYAKGASALRQLVAFVGQESFLAGARRYFAEHAWGNTVLGDLLSALEAASGRDLSGWAAQWLETAGVNTLTPEFEVDDHGRLRGFTVHQTAHPDHPTLRDHRIAVGLFRSDEAGLERVVRVETDVTGARTPIPELDNQPQPDLILVNDGDLTFAKIRMDERSRRTMVSAIDRVPDELTRSLLWSAAWDMCRDAQLPVADYLDMALIGIAHESDQTAVSRVLGQTQMATTLFLAPSDRGGTRERLTAGHARLLRDAQPGSDHQLAFARALASGITTNAGADLVLGWLDGHEVPDGLDLDADLRWHLITELARLGAVGDDRIERELARDHTLSGSEHAAGARAARPSREAKEAAWQRATAEAGIPNETHRQICLQFVQPGQEDLLADFAPRYLELAEQISARTGVWRDHGVHLAQSALRFLFPLPDTEWLRHLDTWLSRAEIQASVRRIIDECRDDALRALAVRAANAPQENAS